MHCRDEAFVHDDLSICIHLMTNLRSLCLGAFYLDPLACLSQLTRLTHLKLGHSLIHHDFIGGCPWISALVNLHHVGLHDSQLVTADTISGLTHLTQLASLYLCVDLYYVDELVDLSALISLTKLQLHGQVPFGSRRRISSMLMHLSNLPIRILQIWQECYEGLSGGQRELLEAEYVCSANVAVVLPVHMRRALVNGSLKHTMSGQAFLRM